MEDLFYDPTSDEDDDDLGGDNSPMQYIQTDLLRFHPRLAEEDRYIETDDESNRSSFFRSENSVSETESTESRVRLGGRSLEKSLLSLEHAASSDSEEEIIFGTDNGSSAYGSSTHESSVTGTRLESPPGLPPEILETVVETSYEGGTSYPPLANTPPATIQTTSPVQINVQKSTNLSTVDHSNDMAPKVLETTKTPKAQPPPLATYSPDNMSLSTYDTVSPNVWNKTVELDFSPSIQSSPIPQLGRLEEHVVANSKTHFYRTTKAFDGEPTNEHFFQDVPSDVPSNLRPRPMQTKEFTTEVDNTRSQPLQQNPRERQEAHHTSNASTNSSSSASERHVQQLGEFLDDLRIQSEGQMKESSVPGSTASFESSITLQRESELEDVLRRRSLPTKGSATRNNLQPTPWNKKSQGAKGLPIEYSNDSIQNHIQGPMDSLAMTFSTDEGDIQHRNQQLAQQQPQNSYRMEAEGTAGSSVAPLPSLPPLHSTTLPNNGKKQPHDRQRRWSADGSSSVGGGSDGNNSNPEPNNPRTQKHPIKLTIDQTTNETWKHQENEIGMFSQLAIASKDSDGATRRPRRKKQLSYRQMRNPQFHQQQESGEDSSSSVVSSTDHPLSSVGNSFEPPTETFSSFQNPIPIFQHPSSSYNHQQQYSNQGGHESVMQSPSQVQTSTEIESPRGTTYAVSPNPPVDFTHQYSHPDWKGQDIGTNHVNNTRPRLNAAHRGFGSFDDYYGSAQQEYQHHFSQSNRYPFPPSPQLSLDAKQSNTQATASSMGSSHTMYQNSPTYYVPNYNSRHQRVLSETALMLDPRFHLNQHQRQYTQYQTGNHSGIPQREGTSQLQGQRYVGTPTLGQSPVPPTHQLRLDTSSNRIQSKSFDSVVQGSGNSNSSFVDPIPNKDVLYHDSQDTDRRQRIDSHGERSAYSVSEHSSDESIENARNIHRLHDDFRNHDNRVIRHHHFDDLNRIPKFNRSQFLPQTSSVHIGGSESEYPTFVCPNCKMRQRQFFTVSSAPRQLESGGMYISLFFALYVVSSLYIFGLQEGWGKLDCIYFAVITLTTAGLGDFVPTTDGSKIICSIFIYFGVASIGLLLGSYIASMLDERSYQEAMANQISACPNCTRIRNLRYASEQQRNGVDSFSKNDMNRASMEPLAQMHASRLQHRAVKKARRATDAMFHSERAPASYSSDQENTEFSTTPQTPSLFESPTVQRQLLGSPMTSQILRRQTHTRHGSMDIRGTNVTSTLSNALVSPRAELNKKSNGRYRNNSVDINIPATVNEGLHSNLDTNKATQPGRHTLSEEHASNVADPPPPPPMSEIPYATQESDMHDDLTIDDSISFDSDSSASDYYHKGGRKSIERSANARYVILTLREALVNSIVIIAFGCLGFYLIEGFSFVDSWYFTTVLLTSTGYGDIVPKSDGGKLFATVYLLVAGTILLNNMSMMSMIPLELRKRRTEKAVLTQFGDVLDDDALRELATGPLVQRINLERHDSRGLDECTREMFALAMMIRLGKVTEEDINQTFNAFRKLDVNNEGVLNSKSIIAGMINKHRQTSTKRKTKYNSRNDERYTSSSQGYGSWMYPMMASDRSDLHSNRHRSSSTDGTMYDSHRSMNPDAEHTPFLSMSDRGVTQYTNLYPFE